MLGVHFSWISWRSPHLNFGYRIIELPISGLLTVERKNDKGDHLQGWSLYLHACKLGLIRVPQYKCGFLRRGRLRLSSYTTPSTLDEAPVSTIQLGYRYGQSKRHTTTIWYLRDVSDSILHIRSDLCTYEQTFNTSPTGLVRTGRTETKRIEKVSLEVCGTWCLFTLKPQIPAAASCSAGTPAT